MGSIMETVTNVVISYIIYSQILSRFEISKFNKNVFRLWLREWQDFFLTQHNIDIYYNEIVF